MSVTLAAIERETAVRLGPYRLVEQSGATAATTAIAYVDALKSAMDLGGMEDLWLLRRGVKTDGTAVPGFVSTDRQRQVRTYTSTTGALEIDRAWTTPPIATEQMELHYLDPANELRTAVLAGLKRCYFVDRATITLTSAAPERDLTTSAAWITKTTQVYLVEQQAVASNSLPSPAQWAKPFYKAGHVWLKISPDPYPDALLVTARRSHWAWVNSAASTTGPTLDGDLLDLDVNYAAAAGHIEAWRYVREKLRAPSAAGLAVSMEEAADEFTRQADLNFQPLKQQALRLSQPYGLTGVQRA